MSKQGNRLVREYCNAIAERAGAEVSLYWANRARVIGVECTEEINRLKEAQKRVDKTRNAVRKAQGFEG